MWGMLVDIRSSSQSLLAQSAGRSTRLRPYRKHPISASKWALANVQSFGFPAYRRGTKTDNFLHIFKKRSVSSLLPFFGWGNQGTRSDFCGCVGTESRSSVRRALSTACLPCNPPVPRSGPSGPISVCFLYPQATNSP